MATVNARYVNPYRLSEDSMDFDCIFTSGEREWRFSHTADYPIVRSALVAHATAVAAALATELEPLELGEVSIDTPEGAM